MKTSKGMTGIVVAVALITVTACGSSGAGGPGTAPNPTSPASSSAPASSPSGAQTSSSGTSEPVVIVIKDFGYQGPLSVSPGAQVNVKNEDAQAHTVTSDEGKAFDAVADGGGGTAVFTAPTKPGSYPYHCAYHANMHGTLVVK